MIAFSVYDRNNVICFGLFDIYHRTSDERIVKISIKKIECLQYKSRGKKPELPIYSLAFSENLRNRPAWLFRAESSEK
jgi:hypothetical protein